MCSPSTENKQVASSSSAVPGRLKIRRSRTITSPTAASCHNCSGTYHTCDHCLLQCFQHLEQAAPVVGEMMETSYKKIPGKYVSLPKKAR